MFFYSEPAADPGIDPIDPNGPYTEWSQSTKIVANDGTSGDYFGYSLKLSADTTTLVVGAYGEDPNNLLTAGSAYVFQKNGDSWDQLTKLTASTDTSTEWFGYSVDISANGDSAVVGTPYATVNGQGRAGRISIFEQSGESWSETQLTASDPGDSDFFGESVAINGDGTIVVVGAKWEDPNATNAGSIYVFEKISGVWTQTAKLWDTTQVIANAYLGTSVSISDDGSTIIAGKPDDGNYNDNAGRVLVFTKVNGTWTLKQAIDYTDTQQATGEMFGICLDINSDGSAFIVGAKWKQKAYLYELQSDTYKVTAHFAPNLGPNQGLVSVALGTDTVAIGSQNTSKVWVYTKQSGFWVLAQEISKPVADAFWFGYSLSMDEAGKNIFVGAYQDGGTAGALKITGGEGAVYVYEGSGQQTGSLLPSVSPNDAIVYLDPETLSGSASSEWSDYLGRSITGQLYGNTSYVDGSVYFDGNDDYIDFPANSDLAFGTGSFSVELWIKPGLTQNTNCRFLQLDGPSGNNSQNLQLYIVSGKVYAANSATFFPTPAETTVTDDNWHHVVLTRYDGIAYLYIDGVLENIATNTSNIIANSGSPRLRIGAYNPPTSYEYKGGIGTVRLYSEALSPEQVTTNYNNEVSRFS